MDILVTTTLLQDSAAKQTDKNDYAEDDIPHISLANNSVIMWRLHRDIAIVK